MTLRRASSWYITCQVKFKADSTVSCLPQNLTPMCPAPFGAWLHCVMLTTESDSTMSCSPRSLTPQCPAYPRSLTPPCPSNRSGRNIPWTICSRWQRSRRLWADIEFSKMPQCPAHRGVWLHRVLLTAESDFTVSCSLRCLTPLCHAPPRVWLHRVLLIMESDSTIYSSSRSLNPECFSHPIVEKPVSVR